MAIESGEYPYVYCPRTGEDCTSCTSALSGYVINRMLKERPRLPKQKAALVEGGIKKMKIIQEAEPRGVEVAANTDCRRRLENALEETFELTVRGMPEFDDYPFCHIVAEQPSISPDLPQ